MNFLIKLVHDAVNTFLHNPNQFASGGILLMAIGAVGALLRKIPSDIWRWVVQQTTVTLSITDDQAAYIWVKCWIEKQKAMSRIRNLDVFNRGSERYIVVPGPGRHWMFYNKHLMTISVTRTEEKKMQTNFSALSRSESVIFKMFGRSQKTFRAMMKEIHEVAVKQAEKKPELYAWGSWGDWQQVHSFQPRPIDTVILPDGDKDRVVREITEFREKREWYREMGIPYRKGMMFYGPPGTGKTSLVAGLSSYFNANVYILKLGDMSDASLFEASKSVEANSFIIVEDVDCVDSTYSRNKKSTTPKDPKNHAVTLSGLLNVMDGLLSPTGAVFIITTNHKEKLDPALIRPGRIDLELLVTYATPEQKQQLYSRFSPGTCPQKYLEKEMTIADLQQKLMEAQRNG